jgi:hypothetical protein
MTFEYTAKIIRRKRIDVSRYKVIGQLGSDPPAANEFPDQFYIQGFSPYIFICQVDI